jgi:hypothetical protein
MARHHDGLECERLNASLNIPAAAFARHDENLALVDGEAECHGLPSTGE